MRSELHEPTHESPPVRRTREHTWLRAERYAIDAALEPQAVDAALADESMPMLTERGSRRELPKRYESSENIRRTIDARHAPAAGMIADESSNATLLRSLAEQLDLLHEQQRQIRRLLDEAGRLRVDAANS